MATLSEAFDMRAGTHVRAAVISDVQTADHPYPCFGGNGLRGFVQSFSHDGGHLLVGRQGALCGNVRRSNGKFQATEHAIVVTAKAGVDLSWAFHKLTAMDLNRHATKSAQPGLAVSKLARLLIALPSAAEQRRVGHLLDKFDALVNDLAVGLPAEQRARRWQYEYYRDRLLAFDQAAA